MRAFTLATLLGLAIAQSPAQNTPDGTPAASSTPAAPTTSSVTSVAPASKTSPAAVSSTPAKPAIAAAAINAGSGDAVTVALDGSAQFTAINAAINFAQNSAIPTVTVLPGTYTEAVTVLGNPTVTIVGATASAAADWSQNQVTITNASAALKIGTQNSKGVTFRNINFVTTGTTVLNLYSANIGFYGCSIVSPGTNAITSSFGFTFFANSYIEGSDKLFANVPTIYLYASTVVPTLSSGNIVYNKGAPSGGVSYNSTVVFDSSAIMQKAGSSTSNVNLAAPNNAGAVAVFRGTSMDRVVSAQGIHPLAATYSSYYGEFQNTGPGSYASNAAARSKYDVLLTGDGVSQFTIDKVFGSSAAPWGSSSLAWIDQDVLSALKSSNAAQLAAAQPVVVSSSTTSSSSVAVTSSTAVSSSTVVSSSTGVSSLTVISSLTAVPSSGVASSSATASTSATAMSSPTTGASSGTVSASSAAASSLSVDASSSISLTISPALSSLASISASASMTVPASLASTDSASASIPSSSDFASAVSSVTQSEGSSAFVVSTSSLNSASGTATVSAKVSSSSVATSCSPLVPSATLVVSQTPGPCHYPNITAAINALPKDNKPYTIFVGPGTYAEQLNINRNGKVTLIGATNFANDYTQNQVRVEFAKGFLTNLGRNEETTVLYAKKANDNSGFAVYNIDFVNTYPQTYNTAALAADFYGNNIAAYGCSFIGYQDTLLANKGVQIFSNCYIEGSVDFVWGFSTAYFHQCKLVTNTPGTCISAQSRATASTPGGYVFDSCMVTYSAGYGNTFGNSFLGRPYSQFSIAVYLNSYIDKHISAAGWQVWQTNNPQTSGVTFGEFNNTGPGAWQTGRASFATNLTPDQAAAYSLSAWIGDTSWIDMAAYNMVPSYSLTGLSGPLSPSTITVSSPGTATATASSSVAPPISTATINAHPDSGSVPPLGAVVVSTDGRGNASYTSLTTALVSLPNDNTNQTIFIYPGSYNEQVPAINRPGAVRIIGYTTGNPGQSYKDNTVTITYSRGLSVSPLPAGHSNAETAVIATASNRISFYNIDMINTDNLDGAIPSYVTLAASIYGNDIGFYGCSFDGWQDTLLTGATTGYQYYESCYIGGAIDFVWGYSKAYFKGCTLGAKRRNSAITAHSRASTSAIGGYIFDQCLFTSAPSAMDDLTNAVYLGRPYSQYALVVVKNSYLDKTIQPAGWKVWTAADPRTGGVTFAEYNNAGPSNWENNVAARQAFGFATLLTADTYSLASVMDNTEWIDMTYWSSIATPQPTTPIVVPPNNTTTPGNSTFNGVQPPAGAFIVSKTLIDGITTYTTIQQALNAAPISSSTNATIFIYPGVYEEQLIITKSGHMIFQGYSTATDDFSQNQVTIQFSRGISTQGTEGSNTDGATVYVKGNFFHAYNINFKNNFGTTQDIASLGFAVQSSKYAGLYGCQIYGNQDTLSVSGNLFAFKTYIEGNIDFIYGSGSAYFLSSTISPNEDGISITAHKRATAATNVAFVFDQCTFKPAAGAGSFSKVGLGRPWNNLARVAYVNSYFDSMISPAGWNQWSKNSPNTDGVTFGEYHNHGPGASICNRASFSTQLSDADVAQFQLWNVFPSTNFINFGRVDTQPFSIGSGTAQTCSIASSSALSATSTLRISVASSTMRSSSAPVTSSILSTVTAYTTITLIEKLTTSTTIIAPDVTSTSISKLTQTDTLTGLDVTTTTTQKVTITTTVVSPDVTSTATNVVTQDVGLTVTPVAVTKNSVVVQTVTVGGVTTVPAKTSTVKGVSTVTVISTSSPKPTTVTSSIGSTVIVMSPITPKGASTTVKTTITIEPSITKTVTVRPEDVVTVNTISTKTVNKKTTHTLACIPTDEVKRMARRGAVLPRAPALIVTLTATTTTTSFVKTLTSTQSGATLLTTQTVTAATKTTSLKGLTVTATTSAVVKTSTIPQTGATQFVTVASTSQVGKTTTLKAMTVTVTATNYATTTSLSTVFAPAVTVSDIRLSTSTQVIMAVQQTVIITKSSDVTSVVKTTLDPVTATKYQTFTEGSGVTTLIVEGPSKTKTVTQKASTTVFTTVTRTAKGAKTCTD